MAAPESGKQRINEWICFAGPRRLERPGGLPGDLHGRADRRRAARQGTRGPPRVPRRPLQEPRGIRYPGEKLN